MPKISAFENNADRYEAWFELNRFAYESEIEALRASIPRGGQGLEVGVGTGRFAALLGIRTGIEPSKAMGKFAIDRGLDVRYGVGEKLPLKDGSFDFILFVTVICFLDDVLLAFQEAHRVLRPGGHVIIGLIDRQSPLGKIYDKRKQKDEFYINARFHAVDEVVSLLKQAGFQNFVFSQTIFQNPSEMKAPDPVKPGHGDGSFVVIKGMKSNQD